MSTPIPNTTDDSPLSNRHQKFANLLAEGNASQINCYRACGYSSASADSNAARLANTPAIKAEVARLRAEAAKKAGVSAQWVRERLRENCDRAMTATPALDKEGNETGEYSYQGQVANKSLELLGRDVGMWPNKVDHSGTITHEIPAISDMLNMLCRPGSTGPTLLIDPNKQIAPPGTKAGDKVVQYTVPQPPYDPVSGMPVAPDTLRNGDGRAALPIPE